MTAKMVRVFGTPAKDGTFLDCITDADNINDVLHMGLAKRPSIVDAVAAGVSTAKSKGWIVVAPSRAAG